MAGSVLASRLSEDKKTSVLVLEAGGEQSDPFIRLPRTFFSVVSNPELDWGYEIEPQKKSQKVKEMFQYCSNSDLSLFSFDSRRWFYCQKHVCSHDNIA